MNTDVSVYLDYNATAPAQPEVIKAMAETMALGAEILLLVGLLDDLGGGLHDGPAFARVHQLADDSIYEARPRVCHPSLQSVQSPVGRVAGRCHDRP